MTHMRATRRGTMLVMVVVLFAVTTMIIAAIGLRVMNAQQQLGSRWQYEQAWWMAESELDRLRVLAAADALQEQAPREWLVAGRTLRVSMSLSESADPAGPIVTIEIVDPKQPAPQVLIRHTATLRPADEREAAPEEPQS